MTYDPYAEPAGDRVIVERKAVPVEPAVVETRTMRTTPVDTIRRIVWLLFGVLQAMLVLRILLLLLNANEGNDIVAFIVGVTDPFVEPFRGMFSLDNVTADQGSMLDVAAVVALIGCTLVEALILAAIRIFDRRERTTVVA